MLDWFWSWVFRDTLKKMDERMIAWDDDMRRQLKEIEKEIDRFAGPPMERNAPGDH